MAVALTIGMVGAGTFAYFTDTADSTANSFTAGTLDITSGTGSFSTGFDNIKPGDVVTFQITVNSNGSLPLNYTIAPALSGNLATGSNACTITAVKVDGTALSSPYNDSLSALGGGDSSDDVTIEVTMPTAAGNEYQGQTGSLNVVFNAQQQ